MSETNTRRELEKIHQVARSYERRGFRVALSPSGTEVPEFLRHLRFQPDLIATSENESLVIEVSSKSTAEELSRLSAVVEAIERMPGWEFVLVMTNPRRAQPVPSKVPVLGLDELQASLSNLHELARLSESADHRYDQAVLLAAWAIVEAALRMYLESGKSAAKAKAPQSLVRDAVMLGFLTSEEGEFLNRVAQTRASVAHGVLTMNVPPEMIRTLLMICDSLAQDVSNRRAHD